MLLFLTGVPLAIYRRTSSDVTQEQERRVGWAFLLGAAALTFFATWANVAKVAPAVGHLFGATCRFPKSSFPCRYELSELFWFVFMLCMHPVLLAAALLYVNETDWEKKETVVSLLWSLMPLSILVYFANGVSRADYWFGGRGGG